MLIIYKILCSSSNKFKTSSDFQYDILKMMQIKDGSQMEITFKRQTNIIYDNDITGRCCMSVLANILKHTFIEEVLPYVIKRFQQTAILGALSTTQYHKSGPNNIRQRIVLDGDDVNHFFGWALMKTVKRYCYSKLVDINDEMIIEIHKMSDDMTTTIARVIDNK